MPLKSVSPFVVLLHPVEAKPETIVHALKATNAIALDILSYSEALQRWPPDECSILLLRNDGNWHHYHANDAEKIAGLKEELAALLRGEG